MDSPNPPSMRVLTRPPPALGPAPIPFSSLGPSPSLPSSSTQPRSLDGVVVVGFIAQRPEDSSQLINRVIDSNVFGSGRMEKVLSFDLDKAKEWLNCRRISYYHDEDKGMLFLQFCSSRCPAFERSCDSGAGVDDVFEEREFGDLHGLLFMFSVCHVIIYIQEVSRFDTQILKRFRVLQAAKQALTPYAKAGTIPPLSSRSHSSTTNRVSAFKSSSNTSPARSSNMLSSSSSAISRLSGLGSYTSLLPGQCTPVILFALIDDFSDVPNLNPDAEERVDNSHSDPSTSSNLGRPILPVKGSGSVVVLARPSSKPEDGFRKKLQSSLEAQIRFLLKKCRTLSGFEGTHAGPRSGGVQSCATLFSLDASRAVVLLDRSTNRSGESLEFATGLVDDVLNGKATSDSLLLAIHNQNNDKDDILSVKEFIYRQSDILRGRGGLVTNTNSSSAAGVGMVAVAAAAAAAASAASGKTFATPMPELPSFDVWLSSSQLTLQGLLSAKPSRIDELDIGKRRPRRSTITPQVETPPSRSYDKLDAAVSWLESARGLRMKFSSSWCERALPTAKDIYMKDLPARYPTSRHEAHLKKALDAFHSMVRGPAVQLFAKKLEEECTCMWKSGRQLCDAVSLTGKPCMHQRHDVETVESGPEGTVKPHSSGYVFLHACACGRTRRLRVDPFDFQTANITFSCFPDCDKLLPSIQLPEISNEGPIQSSSWSLIRVGGARYYDHSKGLLQSGFCTTQKFLFKWTLNLDEQIKPSNSPPGTMQLGPMSMSNAHLQDGFVANVDPKKGGSVELFSGEPLSGVQNQKEALEMGKDNGEKISFGRGLPNFAMKKPFAEVVAGSAAIDSAFPPLQQRKQYSTLSEKGVKKSKANNHNMEQVHVTATQRPKKSTEISSIRQTVTGAVSDGRIDVDPFLQIGSNVIPVNLGNSEKTKVKPALKHVTIYVGFEHECPHGHRFLLNQEHLNQLGHPYSDAEDTNTRSSLDASDYSVADTPKYGRNGGRGKAYRKTNGIATATVVSKVKNETEEVANENVYPGGSKQLPMLAKDNHQEVMTATSLHVAGKGLGAGFQSLSIGGNECAFSVLNRNQPLYMKCPHCKSGKAKSDQPEVKFAGTISQLQRIFLVTPTFPTVLATCPVIQFQASCLPSSVSDREQKLQFSLGCQVILPPESFLALRLPFVYGVQLGDRRLHALSPFEDKPEATGWIVGGTALQLMSKGITSDNGF